MTHRLTTNYAKKYCNRTLIVKVIVENVVTCFFGTRCSRKLQCKSKNPPMRFSEFFSKRLGIFNQFFTHLLYNHFYTREQSFIQICPTLTKLCQSYAQPPSEILHFTRTLSVLTKQMTSLLTSCHIQHVC